MKVVCKKILSSVLQTSTFGFLVLFQCSAGEGIIITKPKQDLLKGEEALIVSSYIHPPHLINNRKYSLRAFALITSVNPLRLYIYRKGLIVFSTEDYMINDKDRFNPQSHISNYGIHQRTFDKRNKWLTNWTFKDLKHRLATEGVDWKPIWTTLKDIVRKVYIMSEPCYRVSFTGSHYNQYQMFSVDLMLDANHKLWLLEHNVNSGLQTSSPNLKHVKQNAVVEELNLVRYHLPPNLPESVQTELRNVLGNDTLPYPLTFQPRLYIDDLTEMDIEKRRRVMDVEILKDAILDELTPSEVRTLIRSEDEKAIIEDYELIFPTNATSSYLKYFKDIHYTDLLLDAWEKKYADNSDVGIVRLRKLCQDNHHYA